MTIRDKVMDQFWLEFLEHKGHMVDTQEWHSVEGIFWKWFHERRGEFYKRYPIRVTTLKGYLLEEDNRNG